MSAQAENQPEAILMLLRDHKRVQDLMFHFEQSEEPNHKLSFAETAMNEIAVHSVIEEECIYPLLEEQGGELAEMAKHSREEHNEVDKLMTELVNRKYDQQFYDKFIELTEAVKHHMSEEERDMFPHLRDLVTDELAKEMSTLKNELLKEYDSIETADHADSSPQVLLFERLKDSPHGSHKKRA